MKGGEYKVCYSEDEQTMRLRYLNTGESGKKVNTVNYFQRINK